MTASAMVQRGLSLIEMMIGLTIGLMLTLGLFTLIANTSQSFKVQDDFSRMQENGATAFRYIGDSVRHAGFFGNTVVTDNIKVTSNSNVVDATNPGCGSSPDNEPTANWAFGFTKPIIAFPDLTPGTVSATLPCIKSQNFYMLPIVAAPNPVLVTRGANGYRICYALVAAPGPPICTNPNSLLSAQPDPANTVFVQSTPYDGWVFYGRDYSPANGKKYLVNGAPANDLEMFEYRAHIYYVRPCSRPAGGGANCTGAADDNGNPIPTLVRQELVGNAMVEVPLAEGIEWIDYRFGIDKDAGGKSDGVADRFVANPAAGDWENVVSVKVTILVRSPGLNLAYDDSPKQYDLNGDGKTRIFRCTAQPPPSCSYKRKVFSQSFQVRNLAQRKGA